MPEPLIETAESQVRVTQRPNNAGQFFSLRTNVGRFVWFLVLLTAGFSKELATLTRHVAHSELHSYILLVPFVSAYLLYTERARLPTSYSSWLLPALGAFALGVLALSSAAIIPALSINDHLTVVTFSFICFVVSGGLIFLGRAWMTAAAFPFFFLVFLIPMPDAMADFLETASKLASTEVTDFFFNITGLPVVRDGTAFQLPTIAIQVAQECSGIRSSWILVITSLVVSNLFLKTTWRRGVLVLFVVPLGIVRNGFRIWVIGELCTYFGPQMIHSIIHRRGGPLFFALSLIPLLALAVYLRRGEIRSSGRAQKSSSYMIS
ncbi:MAG TPA: exosortase/archaeosortase family protein [Terriglobales bacterium]|nr:exosortase/archaeosortase family protein [Terriglobales bacterium]